MTSQFFVMSFLSKPVLSGSFQTIASCDRVLENYPVIASYITSSTNLLTNCAYIIHRSSKVKLHRFSNGISHSPIDNTKMFHLLVKLSKSIGHHSALSSHYLVKLVSMLSHNVCNQCV